MAHRSNRITQNSRTQGRSILALMLILALLLSVAAPVLAQPTARPMAQAEEPTASPLMLGEYAQTVVTAGESAAFGIDLAEDGDYLITPVDSEAATAFDILVTDGDGAIVLDDVFTDLELSLTAGSYTLTFTAIEDGELFFVVMGTFGELSQSAEDPGKLIPGGIVLTTARTSDDYYAILTVPPLDMAQEVLVYAASEDADDFLFVTVEGDSIYNYIDAQENSLLRFWTQGGEYLITASPSARGQAFTLIPFLSGPATTIDVPGEWESSMESGVNEQLIAISLDTLYTELTVTLTGDNDDADLDLRFVDSLEDGAIYESSTDAGSQEAVSLENVLPGIYYIVVYRYVDEPVSFTVSVDGTPGEPLEVLESGVAVDGALLDETMDTETVYYEFNVDEAGSLIQLDLITDNDDASFEINAGRRPGDSTWYGYYNYTLGRTSTQFIATQPGAYYIGVVRSGVPAEYSLLVENTGQAPSLSPASYVRGDLLDGDTDFYQLAVTDPGQILSLTLVSLDDRDLDLRLTLYDRFGNTIHYQSSTEAGGVESVTQAMVTPGLYEVAVRAYDDDEYYLFTRLENPFNLVNVNMEVTNMIGADVCTILAIPSGEEDAPNLLPEETVLADDESYIISFLTGTYTLEAYDCEGELLATEIEVDLQGEMYWNLTPSE